MHMRIAHAQMSHRAPVNKGLYNFSYTYMQDKSFYSIFYRTENNDKGNHFRLTFRIQFRQKKNLKIGTPKIITNCYPKNGTVWVCVVICTNDADNIANSIDADQTAPFGAV